MTDAIHPLFSALKRWISGRPARPEPGDQMLLTEAQAARDAGEPNRALALYRAAVARRPGDAGVMTLLGNMLKDSGDPEAATKVYRDILETNPQRADAWLQLGHALKLSGDAPGAQEAYERALLIDPQLEGARAELAAAGLARHQARRLSALSAGAASDHAAMLAERLARIESEVAALRREIGDVSALRHISPERFDLFAERYVTLRPDTAHASGTIHFIAAANIQPPALHALVAACQALEGSDWTLSAMGASETDIRRYAEGDARIRVGHHPDPERADWMAYLGSARPEPAFCAWLAWAGAETDAAGFVFDEIEEAEESATRRLRLNGKPDAEALAARPEIPPFSLRASALAEAPSDPAALFAALVAQGRIGHVPLPLVTSAPKMRLSLSSDYPPGRAADDRARRISVIIPTRDNADLAQRFVESLIDMAQTPGRVEYLIVDNGAERPEAIAALDRLGQTSGVTVLKDLAPFNWSLLNNRAAGKASGDILLFANDDMLMISEGWDARLDAQLNRAEIGVLGARLLFANDTVQHAGVRLGWRGGSIHEGLGAARENPGPGARWVTPRLASAVTGAFMAVRRQTFEELGGFDGRLMPISHSDLDFCLKARAHGRRVLYDAELELYHFEATSRGYDAEDASKQARFDAEKRAFEARWGHAAAHEPGRHPFWSDYHAPFTFISQPSRSEVEDYILETARTDIWRIQGPF